MTTNAVVQNLSHITTIQSIIHTSHPRPVHTVHNQLTCYTTAFDVSYMYRTTFKSICVRASLILATPRVRVRVRARVSRIKVSRVSRVSRVRAGPSRPISIHTQQVQICHIFWLVRFLYTSRDQQLN